MAVTDLTGYTWTSNHGLNFDQFETKTYNINFSSNNNWYNQFILKWHSDDLFYSTLDYDTLEVYSDLELEPMWIDENYKIVKFIDGDDVTNSNLIKWLEENGTLTPAASGDTIKFCEDAIDDVKLGELQADELYLGETLIWSK